MSNKHPAGQKDKGKYENENANDKCNTEDCYEEDKACGSGVYGAVPGP